LFEQRVAASGPASFERMFVQGLHPFEHLI